MFLSRFLVSCSSLLFLLGPTVYAQEDEGSDILTLTGTAALTDLNDPAPTDASYYQTVESTITVNSTADATGTGTESVTGTETVTGTESLFTTTSDDVVLIVGSDPTDGLNETTLVGNATQTTSEAGPKPTNTRPCNGYPEFCERQYSNITEVAAHNSPFVRPGNMASNQELDVTTQLNDGVRMLQFQTHMKNETVHLCHSSCDMLDAGPLEEYLAKVTAWITANPYDVVTLLIGNADFVMPGNFTGPIKNSGLIDYAYEPPKIPMALDDWPILSKLIMTNNRALIFMDYNANQMEIPYIMDEFSQMWETPFSPTDRAFPCTVQRPPGLSPQDARNRLYMANHNLNTEVNFLGASLLVPNSVILNETNAVSGFGSLGAMARNCTEDWGRPPNFLLVDFYNEGNPDGSVFQVAANMNNVTYHGKCCGLKSSAARSPPLSALFSAPALGVIALTVMTIQL